MSVAELTLSAWSSSHCHSIAPFPGTHHVPEGSVVVGGATVVLVVELVVVVGLVVLVVVVGLVVLVVELVVVLVGAVVATVVVGRWQFPC
jgi:hypothetical protein